MRFSFAKLTALAALASTLALAGCGDEAGNPLNDDDDDTIDTTPPSIPTGLAVSYTETTLIVEWEDNSEVDLAGYVLEKSTDRGQRWDTVGGVLLASTYEDTYANRADYRVRARDLTGNESANSAPIVFIGPTDRGPKQPSTPK
jgi:hypothetical protein